MSHVGHLVMEVRDEQMLLIRYEPPHGRPFGYSRKHPIVCCPTHEHMILGAASGDGARRVVEIRTEGECPADCEYLQATEA